MADLNLDAVQNLNQGQLNENEEALRLAMNAIGVKFREKNKIVNDGFQSMKDIVIHHANDVEGFIDYLRNLNNFFATPTIANLKVYFSPITISIFTGIIYHFNQAVN